MAGYSENKDNASASYNAGQFFAITSNQPYHTSSITPLTQSGQVGLISPSMKIRPGNPVKYQNRFYSLQDIPNDKTTPGLLYQTIQVKKEEPVKSHKSEQLVVPDQSYTSDTQLLAGVTCQSSTMITVVFLSRNGH